MWSSSEILLSRNTNKNRNSKTMNKALRIISMLELKYPVVRVHKITSSSYPVKVVYNLSIISNLSEGLQNY